MVLEDHPDKQNQQPSRFKLPVFIETALSGRDFIQVITMSRKVDLKLNLSQPAQLGGSSRAAADHGSPHRRSTSSTSPSSCVSSEAEWGCNSPEATSMLLAACPRCLMYVMLAEEYPRCPKCHNPVLLDFLDKGKKGNQK